MFQAELKQPVSRLQGIGPKTTSVLSSAGIITIDDILKHYPRTYEDRSRITGFAPALKTNEAVLINTPALITGQEFFGRPPKQTLKVMLEDASGIPASLVCFGRNFLADKLIPGRIIILYGSFQNRFNELQSSAFEFELLPPETTFDEAPEAASALPDFGRILPVYPLTAGLSQKMMRKAIAHALDEWAVNIETELPESIRRRYGLMTKPVALRQIHFPDNETDRETAEKTLKFEELFHFQLAAARRSYKRKSARKPGATAAGFSTGNGRLEAELLGKLGFKLTAAQMRVLEEIKADISSESPMSRMLQGDVGSGKTLVAFIAALQTVERGGQTAFMAPTELLARQHADNASKLLTPLGLRIALLTGGVKAEQRRHLLEALSAGEIDLVIGTHALFGENVAFKQLSLIIIDEQHRFGVMQRLALSGKNSTADLLLMTATPIPRTLAMTVFGDLDVSTIDELPPGRTPVETHLAAIGNERKVYDFVRRELSAGRQAYFVYPLISRSDKSSLKDAESMFEALRTRHFSGFTVGLIHSRLDEKTKKDIMDRFRAGDIQIIAATSVVEVGVDVPNATCMIIEHAERFGLSALHQLRGRVGRGEHQSYAFLVYSEDLTETGTARLKIMKQSTDGFYIAEEDLKIRGPGDLSGAAQSGFLPFNIANLNTDFELLKTARTAASDLVKTDAGLLQPENSAMRRLLEICPPFSDDLIGG
ncbi:MAG: ATP-dependent DNA helicase RecG [Spirochaetales bacterium]|uniref:ATP-dependent DNA helicase RecG n=1 Tax=Candidatus Thalassospirochaeta sargassi TaxID=3119039 RepID=A0AAJ1MPQ2_9SPIO|nr:ATP-dependent DNA helicase RecG [Spirochaetales bacterium]